MQVPVVTISPASRPVPYLESSLAIQVKAFQGLPSTVARICSGYENFILASTTAHGVP